MARGPFSGIQNALHNVMDTYKDARAEQPDVSAWPEEIDAKDAATAIAEASSADIFDGATPANWSSETAEKAMEAISKVDFERLSEDLKEREASEGGGLFKDAMGRIHDVAEKALEKAEAMVQAQAEARADADDGVIEAAPEADVYEAAPVETEAAEADDDPYDSDV